MTRILLRGCAGRMGRMISELAASDDGIEIAAGVDIVSADLGYPVFTDLNACDIPCDVLVDFTRADGVDASVDYALTKNMALLVGTTGLSEAQRSRLREASAQIPVFLASNLSMGIALMERLCREAAAFLGDDAYDAEIVETHHNQKLDAPSGTALTLADAVRSGFGEENPLVFGREGRMPRKKGEIGVHALRGGTVAGIHEVHFFGHNETVTLSHEAQSRGVFAAGALRVAKFLQGKPAGWYSMADIVAEAGSVRELTQEEGCILSSESPAPSRLQQYADGRWTSFVTGSAAGTPAILFCLKDPALDEAAACTLIRDLAENGVSPFIVQTEKGMLRMAVASADRDKAASVLG